MPWKASPTHQRNSKREFKVRSLDDFLQFPPSSNHSHVKKTILVIYRATVGTFWVPFAFLFNFMQDNSNEALVMIRRILCPKSLVFQSRFKGNSRNNLDVCTWFCIHVCFCAFEVQKNSRILSTSFRLELYTYKPISNHRIKKSCVSVK
jgi:hypothetical protein